MLLTGYTNAVKLFFFIVYSVKKWFIFDTDNLLNNPLISKFKQHGKESCKKSCEKTCSKKTCS